MDDQELLKMLAKERYELELMSIELKRLIDLVRWNKEHPQSKYNERVLQIKIEIQNLKMELQRLDLEHLDEKISRTPLVLSPSS